VQRSSLIAVLAATALGIAAGSASQTSASPVPYATGFSIDVVLTQKVDTQTAQVGDSFTFATKADVNLGSPDGPAGTPGRGRFAVVVPASGNKNGRISLQADSIDLPHGPTIWVNIDPSVTPVGRFSNRSSGDIVLDSGTEFRVITIPPRKIQAPLLTEPTLPPLPAASPTT
jgi:hypothetical protein